MEQPEAEVFQKPRLLLSGNCNPPTQPSLLVLYEADELRQRDRAVAVAKLKRRLCTIAHAQDVAIDVYLAAHA